MISQVTGTVALVVWFVCLVFSSTRIYAGDPAEQVEKPAAELVALSFLCGMICMMPAVDSKSKDGGQWARAKAEE